MIQTLLGALAFVTIMVFGISAVAFGLCWLECRRGRHFWRYHSVRQEGDMVIVASWLECRNCDHWEWVKPGQKIEEHWRYR